MKQAERYIYIVIIIILVAVIASGVTYIVMKDDNSKDNIQNNNPNKVDTDKENNDKNDTDDNKDNEQIKLSEKELEEFLSYIPQDEAYFERNVYKNNKVDINTIDKTLLRDKVLSTSSKCIFDNTSCPYDRSKTYEIKGNFNEEEIVKTTDKYIPLNYVNDMLNKMYNYKLSNLTNATSINDEFNAGGMGYIYQDGYFIMTRGGNVGGEHISYLDSYEASKDSLIIYEYAGYYNDMENKILKDYYSKRTININNSDVEKYITEHKTEFTKYKHTFKKSDTGYYWYSTEVV